MASVAPNGKTTGGVTGNGWKPGQSGNPSGRRKGLAKEVRAKASADDLAHYYAAIWRKDEDELAKLNIAPKEVTLVERNKAAEWLADHGYGKAPQHAPVEDGDPLERDLLDERIDEMVDELAPRRESKGGGPAEGRTLEAQAG